MQDRRGVGGSVGLPSGVRFSLRRSVLGPSATAMGGGCLVGSTASVATRARTFSVRVNRCERRSTASSPIPARGPWVSGAAITITAADGVRANYFHVNTDDLVDGVEDDAPASVAHPQRCSSDRRCLRVRSSGSWATRATPSVSLTSTSRSVRRTGRRSTLSSAERSGGEEGCCSSGHGPTSGRVQDVPLVPVVVVRGPDGAVWQLTRRGEVMATGSAAAVGQCGPR